MNRKQKTLYQAWKTGPKVSFTPSISNDDNDILDDADLFDSTNTNDRPDNNKCDGFDMDAGKTWIYPTNYPVRDYQFNIVRECLFKNTLVILPTGLGKTFIAAVVMFNLYRWYPKGKVVFLAPTRPLVTQQMEACFKITGIPQNETAQMTGTNIPSDRKDTWKERRVFFLTPQTFSNDLARGNCPAIAIKCLVIDEAHKATGNYSYCEVVRQLSSCTKEYRVLALTATPGSDKETVKQVLANLLISHVELRTEDSEDVKPYTHARNVEKVVVPLGEDINTLKSKFLDIVNTYLVRLQQNKAMFARNPAAVSKSLLLRQRELFSKDPPKSINHQAYGLCIATFSLCISLYHAYELLLNHGIKSFYNFLNGILKGEKSFPQARTELMRNYDFEQMMEFLRENYLVENSISVADQHAQSSSHVGLCLKDPAAGHPKMAKLRDIVVAHFTKFNGNQSDTRVMIFSQYRDSVKEIEDMLRLHHPTIRVMSFLGQSSKTNSHAGISQKQQLKVIKQFREGGYNTLVATCVGEEGLDIGEVDLIVCYDCPRSPVRLVQRMGRTGRQREGRIVVLVTEGKEAQQYKSSEYQKNFIFRAINNGQLFDNLYQNSPRLVPSGLYPTCVKKTITIQITVPDTKKKKNPGKGGSPFLNDEEKAYFIQNCKCSVEQKPLLPPSKFITLAYNRAQDENEMVHNLEDQQIESRFSLTAWMPWQTVPQETHMVAHSSKTAAFLEVLAFINFPDTLPIYAIDENHESKLFFQKPKSILLNCCKSYTKLCPKKEDLSDFEVSVENNRSFETTAKLHSTPEKGGCGNPASVIHTTETEIELPEIICLDSLEMESDIPITVDGGKFADNHPSIEICPPPLSCDLSWLDDPNTHDATSVTNKISLFHGVLESIAKHVCMKENFHAMRCTLLPLTSMNLHQENNFFIYNTWPSDEDLLKARTAFPEEVLSGWFARNSAKPPDFLPSTSTKECENERDLSLDFRTNKPTNGSLLQPFLHCNHNSEFKLKSDGDLHADTKSGIRNESLSFECQQQQVLNVHKNFDKLESTYIPSSSDAIMWDDSAFLNDSLTMEGFKIPKSVCLPNHSINQPASMELSSNKPVAGLLDEKHCKLSVESSNKGSASTSTGARLQSTLNSNSVSVQVESTQATVTQLAHLLDDSVAQEPSQVEQSSIKMNEALTDLSWDIDFISMSKKESSSDEEICPTPPKDEGKNFFSYRNSQTARLSHFSLKSQVPPTCLDDDNFMLDSNHMKQNTGLVSNTNHPNDVRKSWIIQSDKEIHHIPEKEEEVCDVISEFEKNIESDLSFEIAFSQDRSIFTINRSSSDSSPMPAQSSNSTFFLQHTAKKHIDTKSPKTTPENLKNKFNELCKDPSQRILTESSYKHCEPKSQHSSFSCNQKENEQYFSIHNFDSEEMCDKKNNSTTADVFDSCGESFRLSCKRKSTNNGIQEVEKSFKKQNTSINVTKSHLSILDDDDDFVFKMPKGKVHDNSKSSDKFNNKSSNKFNNMPSSNYVTASGFCSNKKAASAKEFLIEEAVVVSDCSNSEDEIDDSQMDVLEESFINDTDGMTESIINDQHAMYLQSVKDCVGRNTKYKLKFPPNNYPGEKLSQFSDDKDSQDYMLDSFCVDSDEIEYHSSSDSDDFLKKKKISKKKRKRIVISESSSDDEECQVGKNSGACSKTHTARIEELSKKCIDLTSSPETIVRETTDLKNTSEPMVDWPSQNHDLLSFNVSWDDLQNPVVPNDLTNRTTSDDTANAHRISSCSTLSSNSKSERTGTLGSKILHKPLFCGKSHFEHASTSKLINSKESVDSPHLSRIKGPCINSVTASNQVSTSTNGWSEDSNTDFHEQSSSLLQVSSYQNLNKSTNSWPLRDPSLQNSPKVGVEENSPTSYIILVSTSELAKGKSVINTLRMQYKVQTIVMQLSHADYIVSNRVAVERLYSTEVTAHANLQKTFSKLRSMKDLYEKCCVIIEKDSRSSSFSLNKSENRQLSFLLKVWQNSSIKVLFSDSDAETSRLLYELAHGEKKRGMRISIPINMESGMKQRFNFYSSLPHINPISALNFTYNFPNIAAFFKSTAEELKSAGFTSRTRAHSIRWYLSANLKI